MAAWWRFALLSAFSSLQRCYFSCSFSFFIFYSFSETIQLSNKSTDASGHLLESFLWRWVDLFAVDEERDTAGVKVLEMFLDDTGQRNDSTVIELRCAAALAHHLGRCRLILTSHAVFHMHAFVVSLIVQLSTSHCYLNKHVPSQSSARVLPCRLIWTLNCQNGNTLKEYTSTK